MIGNFYFEMAVPKGAHYAEGAAARNTIDGVHYITIHSLMESFTTYPYPTGAFCIETLLRSPPICHPGWPP
jgi:hypothetical protein